LKPNYELFFYTKVRIRFKSCAAKHNGRLIARDILGLSI